MTYRVEVVDRKTKEVVAVIAEGETDRGAERIERGVNINLNRKAYYVRIVSEKE